LIAVTGTEGRSRGVIWIVVAMLVVGVAVAAYFLLYSGNSSTGTGSSGGGAGYFAIALSMSQTRGIGKTLRSAWRQPNNPRTRLER